MTLEPTRPPMSPKVLAMAEAEADRASTFSVPISDISFRSILRGSARPAAMISMRALITSPAACSISPPDRAVLAARAPSRVRRRPVLMALSNWVMPLLGPQSRPRQDLRREVGDILEQGGDRSVDDGLSFLGAGLRRVRADAAIGEARAIVQGVPDRAAWRDLRAVVGDLDPVGIGGLGHGDLGRGGVHAVAGREHPGAQAVHARQVPPVLQLQHEGRLLLDVRPFRIDLGEGRLDGGDIAAVAVEEIDPLESMPAQR